MEDLIAITKKKKKKKTEFGFLDQLELSERKPWNHILGKQ